MDTHEFDGSLYVQYEEAMNYATERYDEGYDEGYEAGLAEGYEDGVYDGANNKATVYDGIADAVRDCEEYYLKMCDRKPRYDEYETWIINQINGSR